jgi:beta-glucosidase
MRLVTDRLQAAFGTPEQGINTGPVHGGERELRRLYLPPFKRAIIDSGAWSVMSSYNSYDGVPTVADHHLLTEILRGEWGYEYFVISDAGGTARLADAFSICARADDECIAREVRRSDLLLSKKLSVLTLSGRHCG